MNMQVINAKVQAKKIDGIRISGHYRFDCKACTYGKMHRLPFRKIHKEKLDFIVEFFHSDICGPIPVKSLDGARYFVTFIDEASKYTTVYFLKYKSDIYEFFQKFGRHVANKFGKV